MNRPSRWSCLACAAAITASLASVSSAQQVGDKIVVVAPSEARMKVGERVVSMVPRGHSLTVKNVNDSWLWVSHQGIDGWIKASNTAPLAEALSYLSRRGSRPASDWVRDGSQWLENGAREVAELHFNRALALDPSLVDAYVLRGLVRISLEQYVDAIADLDEAVRLGPESVMARLVRGKLLREAGRYEQSLADLQEAARLDSSSWTARFQLALLQATCPEQGIRDGKQAVSNATRACEMNNWQSGRCLLALSAAYAELGQFDDASRRAQQALALGDSDLKPMCEQVLALYADQKPFRESPREAIQAAINKDGDASGILPPPKP